jgi:hypothetical protein
MGERIQLKNVRLSFHSIFEKAVFDGIEGKYEATFLIPKSDTKTKEQIDREIQKAIKSAGIKVPSDKYCIRDGDDSEYDGYEDCWSLKSSTRKRPLVLDSDGSPLTIEDGKIYEGCYVYAIIDFWIQDNKFGKRANSNLFGIKFYKDGDPLGENTVDVSSEFDEFDDDDDDL